VTPDYAVMSRVEPGAISIVAQLRSVVHWQAVAAELYRGEAPQTELGKREHAFFEEREEHKVVSHA